MKKMRIEYIDLRPPYSRDPGTLPVKRPRKYVVCHWGIEQMCHVYREMGSLPGWAFDLVTITDEDDGYIYTEEEGYQYYSFLERFTITESFHLGMSIKEVEDKNMKLSFDTKDVYSIRNAEEAKEFIGKKGYFGDSYENLESFIHSRMAEELGNVKTDFTYSVNQIFITEKTNMAYGLFLPAECVKDRKSGYIPYTAKTFEHMIGKVITYRDACDPDDTVKALVTAVEKDRDRVHLGANEYDFSDLFDDYELFDTKTRKWIPFGAKKE